LFQMIGVGFVLLTVLLISSYYFFHPGMWGQFLHKALLGGLAWFTFVLLLIGRCWLGWRGNHAVSYTLIGVSFLLLAYFGTTFIG